MRNFERFYQELLEYRDTFGDLNVKKKYVNEKTGYKLGMIVSYVRSKYVHLSSEEIAKLNNLGFVWNVFKRTCKPQDFESTLNRLVSYKEKHGHMDVPYEYVEPDGIRLGAMVNNIRSGSRKTTDEEKRRLSEAGFLWYSKGYTTFERTYKLLCEYKEKHGDLNLMRSDYINEDGICIGQSVGKIRCGKWKLEPYQMELIKELGIKFGHKKVFLKFDDIYQMLKLYKAQYGDCQVKIDYRTKDGAKLGMTLYDIRRGKRKLTREQRRMLDDLGFVWNVSKKQNKRQDINDVIRRLQLYQAKFAHMDVPANYIEPDGIRLGAIVNNIRTGSRAISIEEKRMLNEIGFLWVSERYTSFERLYKALCEYKMKYGDLNSMSVDYKTEEGYALGRTISSIRCGKRKLSCNQIEKIKDLGLIF